MSVVRTVLRTIRTLRTVTRNNGVPGTGGDGGGATTFAALTDKTTASLPTINTPLAAALALKAPLASPTFTGVPAGPTATAGTNTTQLATTAFIQEALAALINSAPGALDTLDELAAAMGDDANFAATVTTALAGKQPLNAELTATTAAFTLAQRDKLFGVAVGATLNSTEAEVATAFTLAKRDSVGGLTCTIITAPNGASFGAVTSSGTRTFSTGTTWTYGSGLAFLHAKSLVPAYLAPQTLTSSASISGVFTSGSQMDLTLAHAATLTLSAVDDGGQGTVRIEIGGTGGYTLALAHSGLTMRQMGQPLSDIGGLATGQWAIIAYLRAGSNLHHWVTTL